MTTMKRIREDREVEALAMANCLMLLSRVGATAGDGRAFACKTCHKEFSSFQALGGHRASHKRPRLMGGGDDLSLHVESAPPAKPKSHECSICGLEFAMGQALGGHMRRHRLSITEGLAPNNSNDDGSGNSESAETVPVLNNKSNFGKRVVVCLDLNLTPYENHMKKMKKSPSWLRA